MTMYVGNPKKYTNKNTKFDKELKEAHRRQG